MTKTNYKRGDVVNGTAKYSSWNGIGLGNTNYWYYIYEVVEVEELERFGAPAQLLTVNIKSSSSGKYTDQGVKRWGTQLF